MNSNAGVWNGISDRLIYDDYTHTYIHHGPETHARSENMPPPGGCYASCRIGYCEQDGLRNVAPASGAYRLGPCPSICTHV